MIESMLEELSSILKWLAVSTGQASVLICLILVVKTLLRGRLTARWHYWLWLVLIVRLVMPWGPQSSISLSEVISQIGESVVWKYKEYTTDPDKDALIPEPELAALYKSPLTEMNDRTTKRVEEIKEKAALEKEVIGKNRPTEFRILRRSEKAKQTSPLPVFLNSLNILALIWFLVAVTFGVIALVSNLKFWKIIKSQRPLTEGKILDLFEDCKDQMGIQTIIGIIITDKVDSPSLFGVIRPRLLLPKGIIEKLNSDELRYVFLHELAHHRRHDIYLGWVMVIVQVLHWFNPLVWLAFARMRADRELACDALVLSKAGHGHDSARYGQTILHLFKGFSEKRYVPGIAGILENKAQLKRRIVMIAGFSEDSYRFSIPAGLLLLVLGIVGLTNAKERILVPSVRENLVRVFGATLRYQRKGKEVDGVDDYVNVRSLYLTTIERIDAAMDKDWVASNRIDQILQSSEPVEISIGELQKAEQEILLAMYYAKASAEALTKSTVDMEEALKKIGFRIEDNSIVKDKSQGGENDEK